MPEGYLKLLPGLRRQGKIVNVCLRGSVAEKAKLLVGGGEGEPIRGGMTA